MEITRRNFIQFLVGGAVGLQLTPIPWKLTDDIAIWTQNWPWVPVPPTGAFSFETSVCTLCPGGCGIKVRKVDDRAVKIEGRTDYPVNPGGICPVGMGGLQLLYDKSIRFTGPMKRVGPRGAGEFTNISWEEALRILSGRLSTLRKKGQVNALAAVDGNTRGTTMSLMIERFLRAVGSPNYLRTPTAEETYETASRLMQGTEAPMAYDLENADYILSFGCGLLEGWGAPGRVLNAWGMWHSEHKGRSTRIVQIEPRASNTASKADQWVAARPGTEGALALGIAHVIVREGMYDRDFVDHYAFGFNDWRSGDGKSHTGFRTLVLKKYAPEKVARITGLKPGDIVALARDFARAKSPVAISGKGKGALNGDLLEFMAILGLNALVGNINRPGGVLVHEPLPLSPLPEPDMDAIARAGLEKGRLDQAGSRRYPFSRSLLNRLSRTVLAEGESPVDTLLVFSANPAFTLPDGGAFRKALAKIPFIVSFSPYRDETANMADLVLPDHTYLEKTDDIAWPRGLQYPLYGLSRPVVDPLYQTRHTGDVLIRLAKSVGGSVARAFPWENFTSVLKDRAKGLFESGRGRVHYDGSTPVWEEQRIGPDRTADYKTFDEMWEKLLSGGLWYSPVHTYKNWETIFKTPSGKFEFFSSAIELAVRGGTDLKKAGIRVEGDEAFMPHVEISQMKLKTSGYPLLMVPYEMINLASGWIPDPPFLKKTLFDTQLLKNDSFAEIHPKTAAEYHIRQGERIVIESPAGRVHVRANLFEGAMPGYVFLPLGFGHTAYDEFLQGKGENPNDLIAAGEDPLSGQPAWWQTPVRIARA